MLPLRAFQRFHVPTVVILSLLASGRSSRAAANDDSPEPAEQYVQLSVIGKADAAAGTVTAIGKSDYVDTRFAVDFSRSPHLRDEFSRLDGRTIQIRGSYLRCNEKGTGRTPRCDPKRSSTGLFLQPVSVKDFRKANGKPSGKDHAVTCVCRGKLSTGILALGGETTGYSIDVKKDGSVAWELEFKKRERSRADSVDGQVVVVSGDLIVRKGISVADRWIVRVRTFASR